MKVSLSVYPAHSPNHKLLVEHNGYAIALQELDKDQAVHGALCLAFRGIDGFHFDTETMERIPEGTLVFVVQSTTKTARKHEKGGLILTLDFLTAIRYTSYFGTPETN